METWEHELRSFTLFSQLPTEVRLIIWQFALPNRVFELRKETIVKTDQWASGRGRLPDHHSYQVAVTLPGPPTLFWVNREAREIVQKHGSFHEVTSYSQRFLRAPAQIVRTWFDASSDTLCVDSLWPRSLDHNLEHSRDIGMARNIARFTPLIDRLCISLSALVELHPFYQCLRKKGIWTNVRQRLFYRDSIHMHLRKSALTNYVFGVGADSTQTILVDAQDLSKLKLMAQLYVQDTADNHFHMQTREWLEQISDPIGAELYRKEAYRDLKDVWLSGSDAHTAEDIGALGNVKLGKRSFIDPGALLHTIWEFDQLHPWSQGMLKTMPEFELVVRFRLCLADHDTVASSPVDEGMS